MKRYLSSPRWKIERGFIFFYVRLFTTHISHKISSKISHRKSLAFFYNKGCFIRQAKFCAQRLLTSVLILTIYISDFLDTGKQQPRSRTSGSRSGQPGGSLPRSSEKRCVRACIYILGCIYILVVYSMMRVLRISPPGNTSGEQT